MQQMSTFAHTILNNKYAQQVNGRKETWEEVAHRVSRSVVHPYLPHLTEKIQKLIAERKFMPGGRYLYSAGRSYNQTNNCLAGETKIITSEGVLSLKELCGKQVQVLNRFGEWETAKVRSFGVQKLYKVSFHNRTSVYATADHRWWQEDGTRVVTSQLETVPLVRMKKFPDLDEEGIRHGICYGDGTTVREMKTDRLVLCTEQKRELAGFFPQEAKELQAGLTVNHIPKEYKNLPDPKRCSPEYARGFIAGLLATDGSTKTACISLACSGMKAAQTIRDLAVLGGCTVNGIYSTNKDTNFGPRKLPLCTLLMKPFSVPLIRSDQIQELGRRKLKRQQMRLKVDSIEACEREEEVYCCVVPGSESFTLVNGAVTSNCFLLAVEDNRESWGSLLDEATNALMTGGGIGVVYSKLRGEGALIRKTGGQSTGPCALMQIVNELGRHIRQGGSRRSAVWAGLHWNHPDVFKFITLKDWPEHIQERRKSDFNSYAPMDGTNISVILDDAFFEAYDSDTHPMHAHANKVYWDVIRHMLETGEPGFSIDVGENEGEHLRNACTEVVSKDNCDVCNLGSINMAKIASIEEFADVVELATAFLVCGTIYSKLPVQGMYGVREKNRRLGLGLMGLHEWLLRRGLPYAPCPELGTWMDVYKSSGAFANRITDKLSVSRSIATRAIAPTGTISIIAETTSGIEPVFATAFKRRYLDGNTWKAQYVIDATAKRLIESGIDPNAIEDAYALSEDAERRMGFQAWMQNFVDQGISSTINLPTWGTSGNNQLGVQKFGETMLAYLPSLRGITAYPNGARGGQPLVKVPYKEAAGRIGREFVEETEYGNENGCKGGVCGA